jgi:hypothetical protein
MTGKRVRKRGNFKIELSDKELNYIQVALLARIHYMEKGTLKNAGNIPHLIWFSKRTYNRIRRERERISKGAKR